MDFMELALRACMPTDSIYAPYTMEGMSSEDAQVLRTELDKHVPKAVDAMFNNWLITCHGSTYCARRATWDQGVMAAGSAVELAEKIAAYYNVGK